MTFYLFFCRGALLSGYIPRSWLQPGAHTGNILICNGIRNERVKLVSYLQIAYHTIILFLQSIRISNIHPVDKLSPCNEIYYPWVNYNIILSVLHANGGGYSMHLHSIQHTVNKERVLMDNEYYLLLHYF